MTKPKYEPTEKELRDFVAREVQSHVSGLILHLHKHEDGEYYDEICSVCSQDNWQSAATSRGYRVEETDPGYWIWYKPLDREPLKSQETYNTPELAWDGCMVDNSYEKLLDDDHPDAESVCDDTHQVIEAESGVWIWQEILEREQSEDELDSELEAWQNCCEENEIEPDRIDALEHWIVSDVFAQKLQQHNEMVSTNIYGLTIWGRAATGQSIWLDPIIEEICTELHDE